MPRETSDFSVSEQKLGGLALAAPHNANDAPKPPLFVAADIKSSVLGETSHRERTLLHLKVLTSLAERFRLIIDCVSMRLGGECALTQNLCWLSCA